MNIYLISSFLALVFFKSSHQQLVVKNFLKLKRHRLNVVPKKTVELDKESQCHLTCLKDSECHSYNTKKSSSGKTVCEVLNTTKSMELENLTEDNTYIHWHLKDPCTPNPCKAIGRRCTAPDTDQRFICEPDPNHNFALGKEASQSTTFSSCFASLAVDGNRGNHITFPNGSWQCAVTEAYTDPLSWWAVDLGEEVLVKRVVIINRSDNSGERLTNFELKIGNNNVNVRLNTKCGDRHSIGLGLTGTIICEPALLGRMVVVEQFYPDALNVCEVEVYEI